MCSATQGEKAAIVKELREEGYSLKYLLEAMSMYVNFSANQFEVPEETKGAVPAVEDFTEIDGTDDLPF